MDYTVRCKDMEGAVVNLYHSAKSMDGYGERLNAVKSRLGWITSMTKIRSHVGVSAISVSGLSRKARSCGACLDESRIGYYIGEQTAYQLISGDSSIKLGDGIASVEMPVLGSGYNQPWYESPWWALIMGGFNMNVGLGANALDWLMYGIPSWLFILYSPNNMMMISGSFGDFLCTIFGCENKKRNNINEGKDDEKVFPLPSPSPQPEPDPSPKPDPKPEPSPPPSPSPTPPNNPEIDITVSWPIDQSKLATGKDCREHVFDEYLADRDGGSRKHNGIDLAPYFAHCTGSGKNVQGPPVAAIVSGTVIEVISNKRTSTTGFGNYVKIKGDDGREYLYAHLYDTSVSVGDKINSGTPIGKVGSSGSSTGPHLHLEVKENGKYIDPYPIFCK